VTLHQPIIGSDPSTIIVALHYLMIKPLINYLNPKDELLTVKKSL